MKTSKKLVWVDDAYNIMDETIDRAIDKIMIEIINTARTDDLKMHELPTKDEFVKTMLGYLPNIKAYCEESFNKMEIELTYPPVDEA